MWDVRTTFRLAIAHRSWVRRERIDLCPRFETEFWPWLYRALKSGYRLIFHPFSLILIQLFKITLITQVKLSSIRIEVMRGRKVKPGRVSARSIALLDAYIVSKWMTIVENCFHCENKLQSNNCFLFWRKSPRRPPYLQYRIFCMSECNRTRKRRRCLQLRKKPRCSNHSFHSRYFPYQRKVLFYTSCKGLQLIRLMDKCQPYHDSLCFLLRKVLPTSKKTIFLDYSWWKQPCKDHLHRGILLLEMRGWLFLGILRKWLDWASLNLQNFCQITHKKCLCMHISKLYHLLQDLSCLLLTVRICCWLYQQS